MSATVYDFKEQKKRGESSERYLDKYFSRWYDIQPASPLEQRQGIDRFFARRPGGQPTPVEYKTDYAAAKTGNAFLELISVDCRFVVGWAYSSCAEYLMYLVPEYAIYVIRFSQLRLHLAMWTRKYEMRTVRNEGYNARGILVPLAEVDKLAQQVMDIR